MFAFFRRWRRSRWAEVPFPSWWEATIRRNMPLFLRLDEAQRAKVRTIVQVLLSEKRWEGCNGLHVTDEMKLTISAWAGVLILGLDVEVYQRISSILVYPSAFATPNPEDDWEDDELSDVAIAGQAVYRGPVILSWDTILAESKDIHSDKNLVLHEFAHQLDFLDGLIDGTPPLLTRELAKQWGPVMQAAFDRHRADLNAGHETFFTDHAGDDEAEFFADAVESFFCVPHFLESEEPEVYTVLHKFFNVSPKAWYPEATTSGSLQDFEPRS